MRLLVEPVGELRQPHLGQDRAHLTSATSSGRTHRILRNSRGRPKRLSRGSASASGILLTAGWGRGEMRRRNGAGVS